MTFSRLALGVLAVSIALSMSAQSAQETLVYIGTYTGAKSKGIYSFKLNNGSGELTSLGLAAEVKSPSFLAVHPNKKFLYAVSEISDYQGKKVGGVSAYAIERATGKLTLLNQQHSGGAGPCHLTVDRSGKAVLVANYGGGSVQSIPITKDGKLGEPASFIQHQGSSVNPNRQKEPHAHSINVDPSNKYAVAADLGIDKVLIYKFAANKGTITANDPAFATVQPGSGPRHFAFHPSGKYGYVINEMTCTVTAFDWNPKKGELKELQTISTLPGEVQRGFSTAEVQVHPSGKFLYGSNRGHDSIAVFSIDQKSGKLTSVQNEPTQGKTPRNFGIDPSGKFLLAANQSSDTVIVFRIDETTGKLTSTGHKAEVGSPVCVKFVQ